MSVLGELVATARQRVETLRREGFDRDPHPGRGATSGFADALRGRDGVSVIAEFKRESPSQAAIAPDCDLRAQVECYASAGAAAISVLTEPSRFSGRAEDLRDAAGFVQVPLLMKDFVVDPIQCELAHSLGASAVLLIVRCLDQIQLIDLGQAATDIGLDVLVECHTEDEIDRALELEHAVIGINNRDLDTLTIDRSRALELIPRAGDQRIVVAESGYEEPAQIEPLRGLADAVLVGTSLMRSGDPARFISEVAG